MTRDFILKAAAEESRARAEERRKAWAIERQRREVIFDTPGQPDPVKLRAIAAALRQVGEAANAGSTKFDQLKGTGDALAMQALQAGAFASPKWTMLRATWRTVPTYETLATLVNEQEVKAGLGKPFRKHPLCNFTDGCAVVAGVLDREADGMKTENDGGAATGHGPLSLFTADEKANATAIRDYLTGVGHPVVGETISLKALGKQLDSEVGTLFSRLCKAGWMVSRMKTIVKGKKHSGYGLPEWKIIQNH